MVYCKSYLGGFIGITGLGPGLGSGLGPCFTVPELAHSLAEALTQPFVLINPMTAGVADLQGARAINLGHG
jgi:hypothetical protein